MPVTGVGGTSGGTYDSRLDTQAGAVSNNENMSMEDFWGLIAAQLRYQDMTNPVSNSEMMAQMTQMNSMSTMESLSKAVSNFAIVTNNLAQVTLTEYSTSMLGKEVTVAVTDEKGNIIEKVTGIVEGIDLTGDQRVYINGKEYKLSQIMAIGKVPDSDEEQGSDGDGEKEDPGEDVSEEAAV